MFIGLGTVFCIALAVVLGKRMSADAVAVVVGVVAGVAAGLPTSVLLLVLLTRRDQQAGRQKVATGSWDNQQYPPVIVVQGTPQALSPAARDPYWQAGDGAAVPRRFRIVGGEDLLDS